MIKWIYIRGTLILSLMFSGTALADLELAKKRGCMACHGLDEKLVGPPWRAVAKRYRGDASARAMLIDKVRNGSRGDWTELTGGVPMPPYGYRVTDKELGILIDYILGLE